jgi:hypothetical protein
MLLARAQPEAAEHPRAAKREPGRSGCVIPCKGYITWILGLLSLVAVGRRQQVLHLARTR